VASCLLASFSFSGFSAVISDRDAFDRLSFFLPSSATPEATPTTQVMFQGGGQHQLGSKSKSLPGTPRGGEFAFSLICFFPSMETDEKYC